MEQTVFEQVGQQIDDVKHKAARAASAFANVVEDGSAAVRTAARDGASAATEIIYKTRKRVQRHPIESMTLTFAAGLAAGAVLSCLMRPKQTQP